MHEQVPGSGRARSRRHLAALITAALAAGYVGTAPHGESRSAARRRLPAEPAAAVLYVALGDSTVDGEGGASGNLTGHSSGNASCTGRDARRAAR